MHRYLLNPFNNCSMKRIEFVLPVESMRGNLSGEQNLVYAQNNNPAYEAPNGTQYARNYQGRYVGAKISRSGLKYFITKTKSATVLNAETRLTMGTLAAVGAIRSALMKDYPSNYAQIVAVLTAQIAQGIISGTGKRTIMSLFYEKIADMLQGHKPTCVFSAGETTVTVYNPWTLFGNPAAALEINPAVWLKFADLFIAYASNVHGGIYFTINGRTFIDPLFRSGSQVGQLSWIAMCDSGIVANPNYETAINGLSANANDGVLIDNTYVVEYNGEAVDAEGEPVEGRKYTATTPAT